MAKCLPLHSQRTLQERQGSSICPTIPGQLLSKGSQRKVLFRLGIHSHEISLQTAFLRLETSIQFKNSPSPIPPLDLSYPHLSVATFKDRTTRAVTTAVSWAAMYCHQAVAEEKKREKKERGRGGLFGLFKKREGSTSSQPQQPAKGQTVPVERRLEADPEQPERAGTLPAPAAALAPLVRSKVESPIPFGEWGPPLHAASPSSAN